MRALVLLAVVASCWTGSVPDETAPHTRAASVEPKRPSLRVRLERTPCPGSCPVYTVEIDRRQRVARWSGRSDVAVIGEQTVKVSDTDLAELSRTIDRIRFFDRDERGNLPVEPVCTTDGSTTTCTIGTSIAVCSHSTHAIITVSRGSRTHTVDHDHCNDDSDLVELIDLIDRLARSSEWIGRE